ncbi:MAG: hypothetical protein KBD01_15270 [Acidobacteria bacterium]|nr:hypothetical protein [Acidobacteriota bacterium]
MTGSRHRWSPRAACAALAIAICAAPAARASCGSASCFLVTTSEQGIQAPGSFQVDLSFRYVDQTRKLEGSDETSEVLVPAVDFEERAIEPDHHREVGTRSSAVNLALGYGLTPRLSLFGILPLSVDKRHEHFDDAGTPDETFSNDDGGRGFGDVAVGARLGLLVRKNDLLLASASLKLPTGDYRLRDSEGAIGEPTLQPGSGSYDGTIAVQYVYHPFPSAWEWFVSGSYRRDGRNPLEYRIGDESIVSGGFSRATSGNWTWSLQVNARHAARDDYRGMSVPSTGSDAVVITPGARLRAGDALELYGHVQVPLVQRVNDAQLAPRAGLVLGLTRTF